MIPTFIRHALNSRVKASVFRQRTAVRKELEVRSRQECATTDAYKEPKRPCNDPHFGVLRNAVTNTHVLSCAQGNYYLIHKLCTFYHRLRIQQTPKNCLPKEALPAQGKSHISCLQGSNRCLQETSFEAQCLCLCLFIKNHLGVAEANVYGRVR